jgi:hypothetical protein
VIGVNQIIIIILSPHSDLTHVNMSNRLGELLRLIQPFSLKKKKTKTTLFFYFSKYHRFVDCEMMPDYPLTLTIVKQSWIIKEIDLVVDNSIFMAKEYL